MRICNPETGGFVEVEGTTAAAIAEELGLQKSTKWQFKVNGVIQKSAPSNPSDDDIIEMIDADVDTETMQQEELPQSSTSNE